MGDYPVTGGGDAITARVMRGQYPPAAIAIATV